ncbi:unknown [Clostridium sp. CAG:762]|nr:unknown [Clostridium sp. CAG:762]
MIPIAYDGTNWIKVDIYGAYNNWYDYGNRKWANAVMVTSAKRETYMNADVGTVVPEADILAYYVWIPRYKYKLFNATYASGTSPQVIDVTFENGSSSTGTVTCTHGTNGAETCQNKSNGNWYTHPAFTFGDTELKGIWVAKFKTTGSITAPTVKPGVSPLNNINISNMYSASKLIRSTNYLTRKV